MEPNVLETERLALRQLRDADVDVMTTWLADPRILEWWEGRDQRFTRERVAREFLAQADGWSRCLAVAGDDPAGYVQFGELDGEEKAAWGYGLDRRVGALDLFVDPRWWGRGLGAEIIHGVAGYVARTCDVVAVDPQARNARAIHVYNGCGFRLVRLLEQAERHEGEWQDCVLLERS